MSVLGDFKIKNKIKEILFIIKCLEIRFLTLTYSIPFLSESLNFHRKDMTFVVISLLLL